MSQRARNMYYTEGSAARKLEQPVRRPQREYEYERKVEEKRQPRRMISEQADRALAFNLKYTVCVGMAVMIMIGACFTMLFMESKLNKQQKNIVNLESELQTIKDENAAFEVALENMYSLDQIYDVATNELGMVYARKGQIVYYDSANEDYVKQYQDVPEAN